MYANCQSVAQEFTLSELMNKTTSVNTLMYEQNWKKKCFEFFVYLDYFNHKSLATNLLLLHSDSRLV